MKFAVKTVTCLGCKTALKPTNSIKGETQSTLSCNWSIDLMLGGAVCNNCRPKLGDLYQKQVMFQDFGYFGRYADNGLLRSI